MRHTLLILVLLTACAWAVLMTVSVPDQASETVLSPAYAQQQGAVARAVTLGGRQAGEVVVNGEVVFRIRTSAGGLTPYQRAQTVAQRLNQLMGNTLQPEDITTGRAGGMDVVLAQGEIIVTADPEHARINNTSTMQLADQWATRLENTIAGRPVADTPVAEKVVPIISVGTGVRVGGAVVSGASNRVDEVVAVAQVEGDFGRAVRARLLVPVSSENVVQQIRRVPGTSVIGLVDIRL